MTGPNDNFIVRIFRDHHGALRGFLARMLGSEEDAAEVAQEAYLKLHRLNVAEKATHPKALLFRTAGNLAIDRINRRKRMILAVADGDSVERLPDDAPSAERVVESKQALALLNKALWDLPPRRRQVMVMHKMMGLSHREIAEQLGISRSMVEQHMTRALAHCRERLQHGAAP